MTALPRARARTDLLDVSERLVGEFEGRLPAAAVLRCVGQCHRRLVDAGVRDDVAARTEVLVRAVLAHPAGGAGVPAPRGLVLVGRTGGRD